ncbi:MAG: penicillin-binding transpeptidase domain-containing protein, partial [Bacteroidota bacterium]|nr:penicillin-binding transpeptidase domain-containing protein [Bacteroidota bacterium]
GDKSFIFKLLLVSIFFILSSRLFYLQIYEDKYHELSENNTVHLESVYPSRGIITDRNDSVIVENRPTYDFYIIPKQFWTTDTSQLLNSFVISKNQFYEKFNRAKNYSLYRPSIFYKGMDHSTFASIQSKLYDFKGVFHSPKPTRYYPNPILSHVLGYVAEINSFQLNTDSSNYYSAGDLVGHSGVEQSFERSLRGVKGYKLKLYDVNGVSAGSFNDGKEDILVSNGQKLKLTIDSQLQLYVERLLKGKVGSVVAIEPGSGEILAIASSPTYDPNLLSGKEFSKNYLNLQIDSLKPIYNRALMATYPPGSMFKLIQGLIGLEEGLVKYDDQLYIDLKSIGDLAPAGNYDLKKAIVKSSNNYFFKLFKKIINQNINDNTFIDSNIGLNKWSKYVKMFGLGSNLNFNISSVNSGYIPNSKYYDTYYGTNRWKFSNVYSLSIGQGELLVTPLQMANFAAIMANRGFYYNPNLILEINGKPFVKTPIKKLNISSDHFDYVADAMEEVVKSGSARRAYMPGLDICGKTSTVQNPHGYDHSGFIGFAPKEEPKIAIAAYIENSGWGGRAAASISSLVAEKYIFNNIKRKWLEDYVIKGEFIDEEDKQ